jgi:hypothetical protein
MTDLRTRLAAELGKHGPIPCGRCRCGSLDTSLFHRADALLSLPGIAIIELPEADRGEWATKEWSILLPENGLLPARVFSPIQVTSAPALAAALLAAANAADANR